MTSQVKFKVERNIKNLSAKRRTFFKNTIKSVAKNTSSIGRKFHEISHRYSSTLHYDVIKAMMTSHT